MRKKLQPVLVVSALSFLVTSCGVGDSSPPTAKSGKEVQEIGGNPSCSDLGLGTLFEFKVDPPNGGTYPLGNGEFVTVTTSDGIYFDWSATIGMDAVIAKGGNAANVYFYDPEATSDSGLHSPDNASGGPAALSHISFCYDYEVKVEKTAATSLQRTWSWSIDKSSPVSSLLLSPGQSISVDYSVTVSSTGFVDSDWAVSGIISIKNPAPVAATITGVEDWLDGSSIPVDCGVSFPYQLAAGATLSCSYQSSLPDGSTRTNQATVTTSGAVGPGQGSAEVSFAGATVTGIDECVQVSDDQAGSLGEVCAGDAPKTFNYSVLVGPYAGCGSYSFDNIASFSAPSGASGSDTVSIPVEVPCQGCTLTPGYWKTHSSHGPARYDDTWAQLPDGADTIFFLSGKTYYQVLWTAPAGNAYYILAHAFIAAQLNELNGVGLPAVQSEFDEALALLGSHAPSALIGAKALRARFIWLAGKLDAFNNGLTGPGHCSE